MTKAELVGFVAMRTVPGVLKRDVGTTIDALISFITSELQGGKEVVLHGFGKFTVKATAARKGRNPSTGAAIDIPAKKKVSFQAQKALKDAVQ